MMLLLKILLSPFTLIIFIIKLIANFIFLTLTTVKYLLILAMIVAVPASKMLVWKSKKITLKRKLTYVSAITIILGFLLLVREVRKNSSFKIQRNKFSFNSLFNKNKYFDREVEVPLDLAQDYIDPFFEDYNDWTILRTSKGFELSIPKMLTHQKAFRIVIDMPNELLRDLSVLKSIESMKGTELDNRFQTLKFGVLEPKALKKEHAYVSDIPFLGADIKLNKVRAAFKGGKDILWIREESTSDLEFKKMKYLVKLIQNDAELQSLSILITTGSNTLMKTMSDNFIFSVFTFYSCYERREDKVLDFFEERLAARLRLRDKIEIERQARYFLEFLDQDFLALKHFSTKADSYKDTVQYIRDVLNNMKENMRYLESDPLRLTFLKKVAVRMSSGYPIPKNRWLDYADVYEVEYSRNLDQFLKRSLQEGILVQNGNKFRFRLGSIFRVFYE